MAAVRLSSSSSSSSFSFFAFLATLLHLSTISLSLSDEEILLKFKASLTNTDALKSWAPLTSACSNEWVGVVCSEGIITGLHLAGLGLGGKIDAEALTELGNLRTISFTNNSFSGPIPEFNKLGALKALILSFNEFSGEFPDDYFVQMGSLKKVWLSGNKYTGKIPQSLSKLPMLIELHLENNQFTGTIPDITQPSLQSFDVSNNKLDGKIPDGLAKFAANSFAGNDGLCGKPLDKDCPAAGGQPAPSSSGIMSKVGIVIAIILGGVVILGIAIASARRREDAFSMLEKENLEDPLRGQSVPSSSAAVTIGGSAVASRKLQESSRKGSSNAEGSSKKGSQHGRNGMTDLVMVNDEKPPFGLADLMKAAAEVLGNGGLGSAYKAVMSNGLSVVVKRMREMNKLGRDAFDSEMRRLGKLRHKNILSPLSYHYRKEEKLVVSEYIPKGSLLYVLHGDRGICHSELNWPTRLKIIKGIASGMKFLHEEFASYDLPHGNLKSSNVLLDDNYEPLLNDYAFHPLINQTQSAQSLFACKSPEYVEHQHVSPKSDVFCLGIIILEILTGKFPSQYLSTGKGGTDVVEWVHSAVAQGKEQELVDPEIVSSDSGLLEQMGRLLRIGVSCTESSPGQRPSMREAIRRIEEVQAD